MSVVSAALWLSLCPAPAGAGLRTVPEVDALRSLTRSSAVDAIDLLSSVAGLRPSAGSPAALSLPSLPGPRPPAALRGPLTELWHAAAAARAHVEAGLAQVSPAERAALPGLALAARRAASATALRRASPADVRALASFDAVVSRIEVDQFAHAVRALLGAVESVRRALEEADVPPGLPGSCAYGLVVFEDPACLVVVGDTGANGYSTNPVVLVDLGGADAYRNRGGGAEPLAPVGLILDMGHADDVYVAPAGQGGRHGGGFLGAGVLVDEGGNDAYYVAQGDAAPEAFSLAQGAALAGAGVLWDRGSGADAYTSRNIAQGASVAGIGLLLDEGGRDRYTVRTTFDGEGTQGTGCAGGFGALVDGAGDDVYDAGIADLQGMGCLGALGVLADGGGNDSYVVRSGLGLLGLTDPDTVQQSGWGQGYGELGGTGLLLDYAGDDRYVVESAIGGAYEGYNAQGSAIAAGAGVLFDAAGTDSYSASLACQGWGMAASGLLADLGGGNDTYQCRAPADPARANGNAWTSGTGGFGLDF